MIRVQLAKEYRQPDPKGQQTYGKQELLHNRPVVIQRRASPTAAGDAGGAQKRYTNQSEPPSGKRGRRLGAGTSLGCFTCPPLPAEDLPRCGPGQKTPGLQA